MTPATGRLLGRERIRRLSVVKAIATGACAVLAAAVLSTHVPLGFERLRSRIVALPRAAVDGAVALTLPDVRRLGPGPVVLVARVSATAAPVTVDVTLNDQHLTRVEVGPDSTTRLAIPLGRAPSPGDVLTFRAHGDGWQVASLDLSNALSSTRGPIALSLVPRGLPLRTIPWTFGLPAIALLAFATVRWRWTHPSVRRAHHAIIAAVVVLLAASLVSGLATQYHLLLSPWLALLGAAVVALPAIPSLLARVSLRGRAPSDEGDAFDIAMLPAGCAMGLAIGIGVLAWTQGAHVAGGADSSGYISESRMFAQGHLREPQPLADDLPDGIAPFMAAPLGWTPHQARDPRRHLVPVYSPGLPLLMAAARLTAGPGALYLVVPILAALTVWVTFLLGRRLAGHEVGLVAACWLAASPAFLLSMLNPMSDVPVTAWWLIALSAACGTGARSAAGAGAATAIAILTRPNLAPLGLAVFALVLARRATVPRHRAASIAAFGITAGAGAAVVGALFAYWYGSPFRSGYGSLEVLFSPAHLIPNLARYPRWFAASQTAFGAIGVLGPIWLWRRPSRQDATDAVRIAWLLLAFAAAVWACYLTYAPFESWDYLRFVLPSYPILAILGAVVLVGAARATAWPMLAAVTLTALLALHGYRYAAREGVFQIAWAEARYRNVGEFAAHLEGRPIFVAMQHSGSLHYYAAQPILRYDLLPADRLDAIVRELRAKGYTVYAVLDGAEQPRFRARFAPYGRLGALDWVPAAAARGPMGTTIWTLDPAAAPAGGPAAIPD